VSGLCEKDRSKLTLILGAGDPYKDRSCSKLGIDNCLSGSASRLNEPEKKIFGIIFLERENNFFEMLMCTVEML
jgi:hypothetical protein